jgi:tRNA threonylcarbamoyladenosine biosynthesis protein TsaE
LEELPIPDPAERDTATEEETAALGTELARLLLPMAASSPVVLLYGDLGAGKTVFARGFARGVGVDEPIPSPTYPIVQSYEGECTLHHLDLYRLTDEESVIAFGADEYLTEPGALSLVEWPSRLGSIAAGFPCIKVEITAPDRERRVLRFSRVGSVS